MIVLSLLKINYQQKCPNKLLQVDPKLCFVLRFDVKNEKLASSHNLHFTEIFLFCFIV